MPKTAAQIKAHAQFVLPSFYEFLKYYRDFLNDLQQRPQDERRDKIIADALLTIEYYTDLIDEYEEHLQA